MAATESLDSNTTLVTTASASQATESDTVSITAIIHNPQSDEGCDSPDSSDGSTQVSSQVVVTSPASESHPSHYIVAVTDGESVGEVSSVHPTYVSYTVDGTEQAIYATTANGQISYTPVFAVGENYTPGSGQYYTSGNTAVTYTQVAQTGQSIIAGNTYLIQPSVDHENAHTIITGSRTSPDTVNAVQWLLENYECFEGVSLPRSTMYSHYLRHCNEHKLDPVNAASFGKLIRSVFLGLRTRRLGTRGNSKYHYYGIRIKPGSSLTHISDEPVVNTPRAGGGNNKRFKQSPGTKSENQYESSGNHNTSPQTNDNQQYLGDGLGAIPEFPPIKLNSFLDDADVTLEDVDTLRNIYREHCEAFLEAVLNLEFQTIESLWREFWRSQDNNNGDECEEEKYLSKSKLYSLCKLPPIQEFMRSVDYVFYQNIVQVLIPDVLRPIPSSLTQSIRNFAKGLENWLTGAMNGCPQEMVLIKVSAVSALAQTLRRYTSLNHLAQAARAVLQNSSQITQMLADLNRVDFHNVQEQASWVCECEDSVVQRLEADFKATLQQQNSLESWALWLKNVVAQVLKPFEGKPNFAKAARQFLLKWSFYSSMVIRDLTLRSAASFGSFHLIRLLYDEYMFYLVEHEVALATGETPIAVMGERCPNIDNSLFQPDIKRIKLS